MRDFQNSSFLILVGRSVLTSLVSLPGKFRVQVKFAKSGVKSEKCILFSIPSRQPCI